MRVKHHDHFMGCQQESVYDPWKALANAVIEQAAEDYREARRRGDAGEIRHLERWFRSGWASDLSRGLAPVILERLQKEDI